MKFLHKAIRFTAAFGSVLAGLTGAAIAHPHIWIEAKTVVVFDDSGAISAIRNQWTFDEFFSSWAVQGLDTNQDRTVTPDEMQDLATENVDGLSQYHFYTYGTDAGEDVAFKSSVDAPTMKYEDGHTVLSFEVAMATPHRVKSTLELAINDPEYYVAINFTDPASVTLENAPAGCSVTAQEPREMAQDVQDRLYALGPDVTELPPDLAAAMSGTQGLLLISCPNDTVVPATAVDAINQMGTTRAAPFGGPPSEPGLNMPRTGVFLWLAEQQKHFYGAMTGALGQLRTDNNAFWILGLLSFAYGVVHAAGPGHGKIVISSYMLANETQVRRGILLSVISAMMQSVVAVVFVVIAAAALNMTSLAMSDAAKWIGVVSYGMVAALGVWLIVRKLFGLGHNHSHGPKTDMAQRARAHLHHGDESHDHHDHSHGGQHAHLAHSHDEHVHGAHCDHHHVVVPEQTKGSWKEQLGVVVSVGLRPCSGALVVLVFALSQGLLLAGISSVFLMGLGTAITVAALATIAVSFKGLARRLGRADSAIVVNTLWWAELAGAVMVFLFGILLLISSL